MSACAAWRRWRQAQARDAGQTVSRAQSAVARVYGPARSAMLEHSNLQYVRETANAFGLALRICSVLWLDGNSKHRANGMGTCAEGYCEAAEGNLGRESGELASWRLRALNAPAATMHRSAHRRAAKCMSMPWSIRGKVYEREGAESGVERQMMGDKGGQRQGAARLARLARLARVFQGALCPRCCARQLAPLLAFDGVSRAGGSCVCLATYCDARLPLLNAHIAPACACLPPFKLQVPSQIDYCS
jgi:hypothetical protein